MERSKTEIKTDLERVLPLGSTHVELSESDWEAICRLTREYGQLRAQEESVDKDVLALLLLVFHTLQRSALASRTDESPTEKLSRADTFWNLIVNEVLHSGENHLEFHPLPG